MDERLRDLERQAAGGDPGAAARLARARLRSGQVPPAALALVSYVGLPGEPPPRLRWRQDVYVCRFKGARRSAAAVLRRGLADSRDDDLELACEQAPPEAALALLALLDELHVRERTPYRHMLLGRWAAGVLAWGLEAGSRAGLAAVRCAELGPDEEEAATALEAWVEFGCGPEGAEELRLATEALRPDLSSYVNRSGTANSDAYDEARDRWQANSPASVALLGLASAGRASGEARAKQLAESVARLLRVPAGQLEEAIRAAVLQWALSPGARVAPPPEPERGMLGRVVAGLRRALGGGA